MANTPEGPRILVLHRRELHDVCRMLDEIGASYEERPGAVHPEADSEPWRLVLATPQRVFELRASHVGQTASVVAVCDGFSKTLAAKLTQARVDYILRRPVHPGALRLLLLHLLYRGPERRRFRRVSVGAPVQIRLGWRQRAAMLLELSGTGCRIHVDRHTHADARISLMLPAELTGLRRPLRLRGRVVRATAVAADGEAQVYEVAAQFDDLGRVAFETVTALVREYGQGPASWKGAPPVEAPDPLPEDEAGEVTLPSRGPEAPERRRSPRLRYAKPVLVKGEGASRVLMGRDLSTGGMRVMRDTTLAVGDRLKIALYGEDGIPPLMLQAHVTREDGPFLVLLFEELGESVDQLQRLMTSLPLSAADDAGETTPVVVSEIVEQN